jgi:hypothetical protein
MYVSAEKLKEIYRDLDSPAIFEKLRTGGLTPEARELALAELATRKQAVAPEDVAPVAAPVRAPVGGAGSQLAMRVLFVVYVVFLALCAVVLVADPPRGTQPHGSYDGMIGMIASAAAGLPWTFVGVFLLGAVPMANRLFLLLGEFGIVALCWGGAALNLVLFRRYFTRSAWR